MTSSRIFTVIAVLVFMGAALGGCPLADELLQSTALPAEPAGPADESADDSATETTADKPSLLSDLASQIADGSGGFAWSDDSTTISINPDTDGRDTYGDDSGTDSDDDSNGDGDDGDDEDSGDSDDPDGSGDSDDDPPDEPLGDSTAGTYRGTVQCAYRESLWDDEQFYGEITRDAAYEETISFDQQGIPASIPVHPFLCGADIVTFQTTARFVGQTETFTYDEGTAPDFDVTVRVVAATYTLQTAHVELAIDFVWIGGGGTSIVASGTHTLDTQAGGDNLMYSAYTEYEGVFTAADDWVGYGTTEYDCSGTLARQ